MHSVHAFLRYLFKSHLIFSAHLPLSLPHGLFPFSSPPHVSHAPPTSSFLIWSPRVLLITHFSPVCCCYIPWSLGVLGNSAVGTTLVLSNTPSLSALPSAAEATAALPPPPPQHTHTDQYALLWMTTFRRTYCLQPQSSHVSTELHGVTSRKIAVATSNLQTFI
jgi:hypothetical protein